MSLLNPPLVVDTHAGVTITSDHHVSGKKSAGKNTELAKHVRYNLRFCPIVLPGSAIKMNKEAFIKACDGHRGKRVKKGSQITALFANKHCETCKIGKDVEKDKLVKVNGVEWVNVEDYQKQYTNRVRR